MSLVFECRAKSKQFDDKKHDICFHYTSSKSVVVHKTNVCFLFFVIFTCTCPFLRAEVVPITCKSIFHLRVQLVPLKQKIKQNVSIGCANVIS